MSFLSRLESKLARYAVPNLTMFLIAGQVVAYVASRMPGPAGAMPVGQRQLRHAANGVRAQQPPHTAFDIARKLAARKLVHSNPGWWIGKRK